MSGAPNPNAVSIFALDDIRAMLRDAHPDHVLEIADMSRDQMVDFANAFRSISNYARRLERHLRSEAAASAY